MPTTKAELPPSLVAPCDRPVRIPERALSDREVEILWGRDRRGFADCADKQAALVEGLAQ